MFEKISFEKKKKIRPETKSDVVDYLANRKVRRVVSKFQRRRKYRFCEICQKQTVTTQFLTPDNKWTLTGLDIHRILEHDEMPDQEGFMS